MKTLLLTLILSISSLCFANKAYYPLYSSKNTPLFVAIAQGDFQKAENLLKNGANPNKRSVKRATVFHALSLNNNEQGSIEFLPTLIEYGADINDHDENKDTGLHIAIIARKYLLAQEFLKIKDTRIDTVNKEGENIIHLFSLYTELIDPDAVQTLNMVLSQEGSADLINNKNKKGNTSIHYAVHYKNTTFLKILADHPQTNINIEDDTGSTPILISLKMTAQILNQILFLEQEDQNSYDNDIDNSQLSFAHIYKINQILKILLNSPHDIDLKTENRKGLSPDHILSYLIERLSYLSPSSPFYSAVKPIMDTLAMYSEMAHNSSLYSPENTPLFTAITHGNFQTAKSLLKNGVNPNEKSLKGATVFHALSLNMDEYESARFLPTLIEYGADINGQDDDGNTGFIIAILNNKQFLAQTFLQNDQFDIYRKNNKGENILHLFSQLDLDNLHSIQTLNTVLSQGGAKLINTKNNKEQSPIYLAVLYENIELLENLVSYSETDINLTSTMSKTVPIFVPLTSITQELLSALHPEDGKNPDADHIHKASQAIQILLDSPNHKIDLTIKNSNDSSPNDIILHLKEHLPKLSHNSPFYSTFEPIRQTLASIDVLQNKQ